MEKLLSPTVSQKNQMCVNKAWKQICLLSISENNAAPSLVNKKSTPPNYFWPPPHQ